MEDSINDDFYSDLASLCGNETVENGLFQYLNYCHSHVSNVFYITRFKNLTNSDTKMFFL